MKLYVDGPALLEYFVENESDSIVITHDAEKNRANLRRWIGRYCMARDCEAVVVFDDLRPREVKPPYQSFGQVKVRNLPFGHDAVTEIAGPANREARERTVVIVTDEPALLEAARRGRARAETPQQFVRRVRRSIRPEDEELADEPDAKFSGIGEEEVEFWMDFFNEEG